MLSISLSIVLNQFKAILFFELPGRNGFARHPEPGMPAGNPRPRMMLFRAGRDAQTRIVAGNRAKR